MHPPREREHVPRALEGRLDLAALDEEVVARADFGVFEGGADLGEGRGLPAEEFAEDAQAKLAANHRGLAGLRAHGRRLVEVARHRGRAGRQAGGLAGEKHEAVVGQLVAERIEARALEGREDGLAELERAEGARHERRELRRLGGREVEHDDADGRLGVDEVDMAKFALDDDGLARVSGGGRRERVGVHHIDARVFEVHGGIRKRQDLDLGDRPEEAGGLLLHDPRDGRVVAPAENGKVRAHIGGALAERFVHRIVREGEVHLDDGDVRAVLGDHARPIGGPQ